MSKTILLQANDAVRKATALPNPANDPWRNSPFGWIKKLGSPLQRGRAGHLIVERMFRSFGYTLTPGTIKQSFKVNGHVVKVKSSMAWGGGDGFKFQQIEDDPYSHVAMLGLQPNDAWFWLCKKSVARARSGGQHRQESRWIVIQLGHVPAWLPGGHIDDAKKTCISELGKP